MRAQHMARTAAVVIALICTVAGCSVLPGKSGGDKKRESGPAYTDALEAMRPDVVSALQATMPHVQLDESSGADDCGGRDVLDSKDGSKRTGTLYLTVPGDPTDTRQSKELVEEVVKHLTGRGWTVQQGATVSPDEPDGYVRKVTKSGLLGSVTVSASPFKLTSGKISQTLGATVVTDCLRNPDWHKG
ncbi:hypothetical protein [Streptomyces sp. NPDC049915]|uniref:hypothetical protein n=1 Tax=Streptomyces sp. NPDC049915 TaxID=3155510 RepID=UPI00341C1F31